MFKIERIGKTIREKFVQQYIPSVMRNGCPNFLSINMGLLVAYYIKRLSVVLKACSILIVCI